MIILLILGAIIITGGLIAAAIYIRSELRNLDDVFKWGE
jgi:hypothetical protein